MSDHLGLQPTVGDRTSAVDEPGGHREFDTPEQWLAWTSEVGAELLEVLHELAARARGLRAAMIITGDGLNVCTLGVDESAVGQLAALVSSLHSLANASTRALVGERAGNAGSVVVMADETVLLARAIDDAGTTPLLLLVAADRTTLGVIMVHAEHAAARIGEHMHGR